MTPVKVLLRSDVAGLGRRGDIVEVAPGYARNYLFPQGAALVASSGAQTQADAMSRTRALKDHHDREACLELAKRLNGTKIALSARAGEGGRLFGSIAGPDVVAALSAQTGAELDKRSAQLGEHIKEVGEHEVTFHLLADVAFTVTVTVSAA